MTEPRMHDEDPFLGHIPPDMTPELQMATAAAVLGNYSSKYAIEITSQVTSARQAATEARKATEEDPRAAAAVERAITVMGEHHGVTL